MPQYKYFAKVRKKFQITCLLPKNAGGGYNFDL